MKYRGTAVERRSVPTARVDAVFARLAEYSEAFRVYVLRHVIFLACGCLVAACGADPDGPSLGGPDGSTGGGNDRRDGGDLIGVDGGGFISEPSVPRVTLSGVVWAPGNAPGMVPEGHEIPVSNAVVRLLRDRPTPIPQQVYCEPCADVSGAAVATDHDGRFTLNAIDPGDYWLVIDKGQFRLEQRVTLTEGEVLELGADRTTLPSQHDPSAGRWVPRMAVATGYSDSLEDVLGKMGIGSVDDDGSYEIGPGSSAIDFYSNGGARYPGEKGSLSNLVRDLELLKQYHVVFIPCSGALGSNTAALRDQQVLRNLRDYVAAGGKLYVTDWSGEWHDNVFPEQVELGSGQDTPAAAYDRESDTWNTRLFGDADGSRYDSENAEVVDNDLFAWLNGQFGPTPSSGEHTYDEQTYDASHIEVVGNWNTIMSLNSVQIGVDEAGAPVIDEPRAYVIGGRGNATPKRPLTVTYEPAGCGRVLYSTYHTTDHPHQGLVPQERILLYLIMEIGICKAGPILF